MSSNPFAPPAAQVADVGKSTHLVYAGFWIRVLAALIDTLLIAAITAPLLVAIYGWAYYGDNHHNILAGPADFLISYVAPAVATVVFWITKQATPGKMIVSARVVDAKTGLPPTTRQAIGRYLGYYVSLLGLGLGILWVAFDRRKQGWHDKLAGTVVVRTRHGGTDEVRFDDA